MAIACRTCGNQNPDGVSFCQYCGSGLQPAPSSGGQETVVVSQPPAYQQQPYGQGGYGQQQGYPAGQYGQPQYGQPQYGAVATPAKDPTTGLLLELIGFLTLLGIGWIWAGETTIGVVLLIGYLALWYVVTPLFVLVTFGFGIFCLPLMGIVWLVAPLLSGFLLQKRLKERQLGAIGG